MKRLLLLLLLTCNTVLAAGVAGLNYSVYGAGGATPNRTVDGRPLLAIGVSPNINYNWGGGGVMGTPRSDGVIIRWTGFIKWPEESGQKTVTFYNVSDDGFHMSINGTTVINDWQEQGPAYFNGSGSITLTAGQTYAIEIWWYENGGGAVAELYWDTGSGITLVPTSNLATDSTFWVPPLCCGGSSTAFSINNAHATRINAFVNRTTNDAKTHIEQIGNGNNIEIQQQGTKNNYINYYGSGFNNEITIVQSGTTQTIANYTELNVVGNSNNVNITQQSTGGTKSAFVTTQDNNNTVSILQKDNGSHYLNLALSGGGKNVSITQQGSASHMASIDLSGFTTSLSLTQSGLTQQFYSIQHHCALSTGCAPISVTQGK